MKRTNRLKREERPAPPVPSANTHIAPTINVNTPPTATKLSDAKKLSHLFKEANGFIPKNDFMSKQPQFTGDYLAEAFRSPAIESFPPSQQDSAMHIRIMATSLANSINANCPDGRYKAIAMTHLEEAIMWANKALV